MTDSLLTEIEDSSVYRQVLGFHSEGNKSGGIKLIDTYRRIANTIFIQRCHPPYDNFMDEDIPKLLASLKNRVKW